jgi:ribonucleoside-triphosphate reductase
MEALIHNLNSMHSRAGSQIPFTSLNFGTDTSDAGRMVTECFLLALEQGLGAGETPVFPISVFKVKSGVNYEESDENYDLFKLAMKVSAKRLFPNFVFIDSPCNLAYYLKGKPETEVATMGCRTRVISSVFPESDGYVYGRGNLSFTSINLPRIALEVNSKEISEKIRQFIGILMFRMQLAATQLLHRFEIQCSKTVKNFPFLLGQGIWFNSSLLDKIPMKEVLKHGTLSIGFIGLAEAMCVLYPFDKYSSEKVQKTALNIIEKMKLFCSDLSVTHKLNFTLLATPAESLSGRFVKLDKKRFGIIKGVTDREYYTNSFHVPVYEKVDILTKIRVEAPYHALCNAGAITYVEVDGNLTRNEKAFETIIRLMHNNGIRYGAINHPIDRCMSCSYEGEIPNRCSKCLSENIERIRRITGYLVGTMSQWNPAKKAEEMDRIKHFIS